MKMRTPQKHKYTDVDLMSLETKIKVVVSIALSSRNLNIEQVIQDNIPKCVTQFGITWHDYHVGIMLRIKTDDKITEKHICIPRPNLGR